VSQLGTHAVDQAQVTTSESPGFAENSEASLLAFFGSFGSFSKYN
jgi:hypothetical protein